MFALLLACHAPDPAPKLEAADTGTAPDTDPADTGTVEVPEPATGGRLVAWGHDGVFVERDDGSLLQLTDEEPAGVNASGDTVTTRRETTATVYDALTGAVLLTYSFPCAEGEWLSDALHREGALWGICLGDTSASGAFRVDADGLATFPLSDAHAFQSDQGALYAVTYLGREGTFVTRVDPARLEPTSETLWLGANPLVRAGAWAFGWDEAGRAGMGGLSIGLVDAPESRVDVEIAYSEVVNPADAVYGEVALVGVSEHSSARGGLVDMDGNVLDSLPACYGPRLVWNADEVVGWCGAPLVRYTWARTDGGWTRTDERAYAEDVRYLQVVEPGD